MKTTDIRRRKNYSVHPDRASDLARVSIRMGDELQVSVKRQAVIDELIHLANTDATVYNKIKRAIKASA